MPNNLNGAADQSLKQLQRRFEQWRGRRRQPGRIPTELWTAAAYAAASQGVQKTADSLRLDARRLKQWMEQLQLSPPSAAQGAPAAFVDLSSMLAGATAECHLEVEETSGRKLRILLKGPAVSHAAAVIGALCKERQS